MRINPNSIVFNIKTKDYTHDLFESVRPSYQKFDYRFQRNGLTFSMALFYSPDSLDEIVFTHSIRTTDKIIRVYDNLFCIIFDISSGIKGFKACQNILSAYETKHFSQQLYISYASIEEYPYEEIIFSHLKSFLDYALKENLVNQVTDGFHELETV